MHLCNVRYISTARYFNSPQNEMISKTWREKIKVRNLTQASTDDLLAIYKTCCFSEFHRWNKSLVQPNNRVCLAQLWAFL